MILDLMDKRPKRMHLQYLDEQTGHDINNCRLILKKNQDNNDKDDRVVGEEQFNGETFPDTDANNNEIAMVEAIKNNGDRVVDTCVRDDTLNTTVALNGTLATVSQTLILVPMINLEYNLASNPNLPAGGVLSGKDPCLSTTEDPDQANKTINYEDKVLRKVVCSNTFDALMIISNQELHALSTPFFLVSHLETIRIIKEPYAAMLNKANPMVKSPMATINTSDHDVPSPYLESLGEKISSASRWAYLVEEEEHISSPARSKLSPQAPICVPSSKANQSMEVTIDNSRKNLTISTKVLVKTHEPEDVVSRLSRTTTYDIDLGSDMFDKDNEDDMQDILFDKVYRIKISHLRNKEVEAIEAKRRHMKSNILGMVR
ncbi:hypothetical protein H5410_003826 [Solanum commersonii]|uniref:Uncharacterized protein n=1 Tax=Solanum commersonii TaxID=4109 RepID=A0A9J6B5Q1_SOLCO|nr:hypothetical protein H5410_003826 [Solanum commersonii]